MVSVVNASGNQDIDGILWGWKYDSTNISFSFPTGTSEYSSYSQVNGFEAFSSFQANAARQALTNIGSFTNLTFSETTSPGAQLRFAQASSIDYTDDSTKAQYTGLHTIDTAEGNPPTAADGNTPPFTPAYAQGDMWFNPTGYDNPTIGSFQDAAGVMHELGHAMGLKHGHVTQDGHGVTFPALPTNHNSYEYSVMTYSQFPGDSTADGDNAPDHPTTYMQDDIAALQYMYGANYGYHAENTTYSWNSVTGQEFINGVGQTDLNGEAAPADGEILMTVWDGGGNDTYDFSNYSTDLSVDLNPGGYTILDTSAAHLQRADLGNTGGGAEQFARGNIFNALVDPNNTAETVSLIDNAIGGWGNDTIIGNQLDNILQGSGGNDTLKGGGGADTLLGGANDDTLKGGGGADHLDGGTGNDTVDYAFSAAVNVSLATGFGFGGDAEGDTLVNIENISGSANDDTLTGDANINRLLGGSGNDTLKGGGGADYLDGGVGIDTASYVGSSVGVTVSLSTGTGSGGDAEGDTLVAIENLTGSFHDDTLTGDANVNIINGLDGNDTVNAGAGADTVNAGSGNDRVVDDDFVTFDVYDGGTGVDTIDYSLITFADGVVTINLATGQTSVSGGNTETILNFENVEGSQGGETIIGSDVANVLDGNGGNDVINGGLGNDILRGGAGTDQLDGGGDTDTADYTGSSAAVTVSLVTGTGSGGDAQGDTLVNIENLTGSLFADTLTGDGNNNVLNDGGIGGNDILTGNGGNDIYRIFNAGDQVIEAVGGGNDIVVVMSAMSYTLSAGQEVERLQTASTTSTLAINLTGNEFANTLYGNAAGNTLNGGAGADNMYGYAGNDAFYVDNVGDKVFEAAGNGTDAVVVTTAISYTLNAGQEIEKLQTASTSGTLAINLTGNDLVNAIIGNAANNKLDGGGGADTMYGYAGNDVFSVDNVGDKVIEAAGGGNDAVVVTSAINYVLTAGQEVEKLQTANVAGLTAINLTGNDLVNTVIGNAAANVIDGKGGNDTLYGEGGNDTFVFDTTPLATNRDTIADFTIGQDMVDLSHAIFAAVPIGGLAPDAFTIGSAATTANQHVIYNSGTGGLSFDADGNGAGAAVQFARLSSGLATLNASSFQVIA